MMLLHREANEFIKICSDSDIEGFHLYIKNTQGQYRSALRQTSYVAGTEHEQFIGKSDRELIWSHFSQTYEENDAEAMAQAGPIIRFEDTSLVRSEKNTIYSVKQALFCDHGNVAGVFGISFEVDIVAPKTMNALLQDLSEKILNRQSLLIPKETSEVPKALLNKREREICYLLCLGMSAGEIASRLRLSRRTIEDYLAKLKEKFNCCKRSQLIRYLIQNRVVILQ